MPTFTVQQTEVLRLLGDGLSNKAIAKRLDIGEPMVKAHIGGIICALDCPSRTRALVAA